MKREKKGIKGAVIDYYAEREDGVLVRRKGFRGSQEEARRSRRRRPVSSPKKSSYLVGPSKYRR